MSVLLAVGEVSFEQDEDFRLMIKESRGDIPTIKHCSVEDWRDAISDFENRISSGPLQIEPRDLVGMTFSQIRPNHIYFMGMLAKSFWDHTGTKVFDIGGVILNQASESGQIGVPSHRLKFDDYSFVAFIQMILARWIPVHSHA